MKGIVIYESNRNCPQNRRPRTNCYTKRNKKNYAHKQTKRSVSERQPLQNTLIQSEALALGKTSGKM